MFSKERFIEFKDDIGPHSYAAIVQLAEQRQYSIEKIINAAKRQMQLCENVITTGEPYTVATAEQTQVISEENARDFLSQAYQLYVGAIIYGVKADMISQIPQEAADSIDDEIFSIYMVKAELWDQSKQHKKPTGIDRSKIRFKGW